MDYKNFDLEIFKKLKEGDSLSLPAASAITSKGSKLLKVIEDLTNRGVEVRFTSTDTCIQKHTVDYAEILILVGEHFKRIRETQEKRVRMRKVAQKRHQGRKPGEFVKSKLDQYEESIMKAVASGTEYKEIAEQFGVARTTLYSWLKNRNLARRIAKEISVEAEDLTELKRKIRQAEVEL